MPEIVERWEISEVRPRREMQMIFEDHHASLNPRLTVEDIVAEPLRTFSALLAPKIVARVSELLEQVGLDAGFRKRYPNAFSERIALHPRFIVCDELGVSIQAQIPVCWWSCGDRTGSLACSSRTIPLLCATSQIASL